MFAAAGFCGLHLISIKKINYIDFHIYDDRKQNKALFYSTAVYQLWNLTIVKETPGRLKFNIDL